MSGDIQLELWLHEYKMQALASALEKQGVTVEQKMQDALTELYVELVPADARQEISARIKAELAAEQEAAERERKYTAFRVRENGTNQFFQIGQRKTFLDLGRFLREYLAEGGIFGVEALRKSFSDLAPISAEQYNQLMESRLENPNKVTDVHELDFDKQTASTVAIGRDWRTYSMKDISAAAYFAFRKSGLGPFQHEARFENKLIGKERSSAGHLSAKEISLAEEICEMDGQRLNFYLETYFDVDAVFGTHVCTAENDDTLNVYADYDMATGQVCDELEVDLHRADGREESVEYRLNAVEKATLLWKMEEYCWQQTGQSLKDYSAGLMAEEEIVPPAGPTL